MRRYGVMLGDIREKVEPALVNKSGNFLVEGGKEYPIRILVAPYKVTELEEIAIGQNKVDGRPIRLADIATVTESASPIRGSGAIDGKEGVILRVIRQPDAQTLAVTEQIDSTLRALSASVPAGVEIHPNLFRQENFIRAGLGNVESALRDGTILVVIVLIIFLMNIRMTMITLTAIPLSILVTAIVFKQLELSVNVLTLGGIALAVGELVDDAIVDVQNIFRRLRLWKADKKTEAREGVIFSASSEVRNSIAYATFLVIAVFYQLSTNVIGGKYFPHPR